MVASDQNPNEITNKIEMTHITEKFKALCWFQFSKMPSGHGHRIPWPRSSKCWVNYQVGTLCRQGNLELQNLILHAQCMHLFPSSASKISWVLISLAWVKCPSMSHLPWPVAWSSLMARSESRAIPRVSGGNSPNRIS